jgi:serine/threonine-protein kinase
MPPAPIDGKYEVLARLGGGGMGETYLVRHRHLEQARVVKVMRAELIADADLRARFLREARIASRIEHPRIARLHDFEVAADGTAFLVLEHVPGYSLAELAKLGPLPAASVGEVGRVLVEALAYLHEAGYLHRDVAPDNVMAFVDERGRVGIKLIDLGIAKALVPTTQIEGTRGDAFIGKPLYASPEQIRTEPLTSASDYYSLGAMLYELATGVFPYRYSSLASLVSAHMYSPPIAFTESDAAGRVSDLLRATILRLLDKEAARRLDSPVALAAAFDTVAGDDGAALLAQRVREAAGRLGPRDAESRADGVPHTGLQRLLDSRFRDPTDPGATPAPDVAPTVILAGDRPTAAATAAAAPQAPQPVAPPPARVQALGARLVRALPAVGQPRGRFAVAGALGGLAFLTLFILILWIVGRTPHDDPFEAVVYSFPENFRINLGLYANFGWKQTLVRQIFAFTALLPGIAAGLAGASARRRGWPGWLTLLLGALAAFLFLLPYLPPIGSYDRYVPFQLVAAAYLASGAVAGRVGAAIDQALASG